MVHKKQIGPELVILHQLAQPSQSSKFIIL